MVLVMRVDSTKVENMLNGYTRTLPDGAQMGIDKLTRFAAKTYLDTAIQAGIRNWRGKMFNSLSQQMVQPRKRSRFVNYVFMPKYGVQLDSMRPHWVALKRGRNITQWARDHSLGLEPTIIKESFGKIYVRPHPFITRANLIIGKNVKRIIEKELNRKIRRKGR